jgi:DNA-binding response OmpR family regulator
MRLLLVDDDAELRGLMTEFFGSHGIDVETAQDGAQVSPAPSKTGTTWCCST